jgi:hypothetical protein
MNDMLPATTTAGQEIDGKHVCFSFGTLHRGFIKRYEWTIEVPSVDSGFLFRTWIPEKELIE